MTAANRHVATIRIRTTHLAMDFLNKLSLYLCYKVLISSYLLPGHGDVAQPDTWNNQNDERFPRRADQPLLMPIYGFPFLSSGETTAKELYFFIAEVAPQTKTNITFH